ncbi:NAD(P)H-binding protein [Gordonia zhaorongruii]|uniref:NAD(P)H-binding protein n=1 Tax=Gordonia zhaorongruii TaxID=2597659 RepID=UPI00104CD71A|nr:NAD(P)H-binding protein [Gordonia zhaorongruii]
MTIAIIGATGKFGGHVIDALLERGVASSDVLALGRDGGRLEALASRGLRTAPLDLANEAGTAETLRGVDRLLLVSIGAPGAALAPRTAAIDAAAAAGVPHLVYTSALGAPTTSFALAAEHKATEDVITASGIPATFLRNGWWTENLQQDFETARDRGVIANSIGDGRLATATRRDTAEAAAVVLTTPGHESEAYELSGDAAWDYAEFAQTAQDVLGKPVRYEPLSPEQEREMLLGAGLDEATVGFLGVLNQGMREGTQALMTGDLSRLIGRPTTPLETTMRSWI